ncbi:hypothetical protein EOPP23_03455 [Endozoicomonas sp. OPT23]|uniref:response regulator n=1 Tax=Endozoicomonas sp. OPT23 TaxID=2072845 RepID=UPI00129BA8DE|nr:response regulator [Endozoicomonas sp. OPT23]MRI32056.1 hypothetical protein [Endozoicomonas sp. OPT23]
MNCSSDKKVILIVDDTPENIDILREILVKDCRVKAALSGMKALSIARAHPQPDLILLDIMMPGMDGYEVCELLSSDPETADIPIIFISAMGDDEDKDAGMEAGAVDYISKPAHPQIIRNRVASQLSLKEQKSAPATRTLMADPHLMRIAHSARHLAKCYGENEQWAEELFQACLSIKLGQTLIPEQLNSSVAKTDLGAFHERWDGQGCPHKLSGTDIPLAARILSLVSAFDALAHTAESTPEKATQWLISQSGSRFDPSLVNIFQQETVCLNKIQQQYQIS